MNCQAQAVSTGKTCKSSAKFTDGVKKYCFRHGDKDTMKRIERCIVEENVLSFVKPDMSPSVVSIKRQPYASIPYTKGYYPVYLSEKPSKEESVKPGTYLPTLAMDSTPIRVLYKNKSYSFYSFAEFVNMYCFTETGIKKVHKTPSLLSKTVSKRRGSTKLPTYALTLALPSGDKVDDFPATKATLSELYSKLICGSPEYRELFELYKKHGSIQLIGYGTSSCTDPTAFFQDKEMFFSAENIIQCMLTMDEGEYPWSKTANGSISCLYEINKTSEQSSPKTSNWDNTPPLSPIATHISPCISEESSPIREEPCLEGVPEDIATSLPLPPHSPVKTAEVKRKPLVAVRATKSNSSIPKLVAEKLPEPIIKQEAQVPVFSMSKEQFTVKAKPSVLQLVTENNDSFRPLLNLPKKTKTAIVPTDLPKAPTTIVMPSAKPKSTNTFMIRGLPNPK